MQGSEPAVHRHEDTITHALILANGEPPSDDLLRRLIGEADLFIAADGAANRLPALGIVPDVVLGDFDSLAPDTRARLPGCEFVDAWDQEASDLDKAIASAIGRGAERITVAGAGGGRIDHALAAVSILMKYADRRPQMVDDVGELHIVAGTTILRGSPGDTLSLIAFGEVGGVTATGVRWPLTDETLCPGSRGVSNEFLGDSVAICVRSGILVAVHLVKRSQQGC